MVAQPGARDNAGAQSCGVRGDAEERDAGQPHDGVMWRGVALSDVLKTNERLDASAHDARARLARETVSGCRWGSVPLCGDGGLATAYVCGRFKRVWLGASDLPIYQPSSIMDVRPEPCGYLSSATKADLGALRVREGQVLLTCSGTVGNVAYASAALDGKIFSHDLIRIDAKDAEDAGFIYAFLRSGIGGTMLRTNSYGAVIRHIEPEHLAGVPVPDLPDGVRREISGLVRRSFASRDKSNALLDEADAVLASSLALPPVAQGADAAWPDGAGRAAVSATEADCFCVRLSDLDGRLDGSYHAPAVTAVAGHLRAHAAEVTAVGDGRVSKAVTMPGRFKRIYVGEGQGRVFIGSKQIHELDPSDKKYLSLARHGDRIKKQLELRENMTLVTCSGTIGKAALVPRHWDGWAASQHIIRIVPANDGIAGYIYAFLATGVGRALAARSAYGSVVDEIDARTVAGMPFPFLKNAADQARVNSLALEANELRYQAYKLERAAMEAIALIFQCSLHYG